MASREKPKVISLEYAVNYMLESDGSDIDASVGGLSSDEEERLDDDLLGYGFNMDEDEPTETVLDDIVQEYVAAVQSKQHNEVTIPDVTASSINSSEKTPTLKENLQPSTSSQQQTPSGTVESTFESTNPPNFYSLRLRNRSKLLTNQTRQLIDFESDVSESNFEAGESETECKPIQPPLKKRLLSSKSKRQSQKAKADHQTRNSNQKTNTRSRKSKSVKEKPMVNMAIVNGFIIFQAHRARNNTIDSLKRPNSYSLLEYCEAVSRQLTGMPEYSDPPVYKHFEKPIDEKYKTDHIPVYTAEKRNCKLCYKKLKIQRPVFSKCSAPQCNVHLHFTKQKNCFAEWHTTYKYDK